jgi:hypothetical protein
VEESVAVWWAVVLAIDAMALGSVWTSRRHSRKAKTLWSAIVCAVPLFGALAWLLLGRERRRRVHRLWLHTKRAAAVGRSGRGLTARSHSEPPRRRGRHHRA